MQNKQVYVWSEFTYISIYIFMYIYREWFLIRYLFVAIFIGTFFTFMQIEPNREPTVWAAAQLQKTRAQLKRLAAIRDSQSGVRSPDISRLCHYIYTVHTYIECTPHAERRTLRYRPRYAGLWLMVTATVDKRETWLNNFFPRSAVPANVSFSCQKNNKYSHEKS